MGTWQSPRSREKRGRECTKPDILVPLALCIHIYMIPGRSPSQGRPPGLLIHPSIKPQPTSSGVHRHKWYLSYPMRFYPDLTFGFLCRLFLSCPVLSCPVLSFALLFWSAMPCHALTLLVLVFATRWPPMLAPRQPATSDF